MDHIQVKAKFLRDNGNGTITIEIEGRYLTQEENDMLLDLFPDLQASIETLLHKQALLKAVR